MSCVREASLEPPAPYHVASAHAPRNGEGRKGRFFRGLRRMFRRRAAAPDHSPDSKSRSTSELLHDIRQRRKEGAYSSGLSVSHDSVFTGDRSADESSDERAAQTPLAPSGHRAELAAALRRRGRGDGSDDDEDLGLPRSPPASPPTDKADKRHHAAISASSCSDGSLLSVGSSEMDEDSSHHDSARSDFSEYTGEPPSGVAPLSHSAARHKMAVRPRRTHGAPRRNKNMPIATPALPITPELNEEMIRSATPEVQHKTEVVTESFSSSTTTKVISKETHSQFNKELSRVIDTTHAEVKLKSSSLPPGLALSHLMGQSPAKLSLAESKETPRSSIKRSKSSTQGKSLADETTPSKLTVSETNVSKEEVRRKDEKKEKKAETTRTSRKDESFFSRLLLRRSKKDPKAKKDSESDHKKEKPPDKLLSPQYKSVDREYSSTHKEYGKIQQRTQSADRSTQIGHKVFSNQSHKRMDSKGVYTHDTAYSISKSSIDYGANDLKIAEETDKLLNMDLKYSYRPDKSKRLKEEFKDDLFNLHMPERWKKPVQVVDPYQPKAFNQEATAYPHENIHLSPKIISDEVPDAPLPIPRQRPKDFAFHSGSMPKKIPYFNQHFKLSASASPPKSVLLQNSDNLDKLHRSSDLSTIGIPIMHPEEFVPPVFGDYPTTQTEKDYASELRSLGEEYIEPRTSIRTSIGKSHSFRHQSEVSSINSHEQMPSLPAIVGISENLMESWEVNYRRSVSNDSSRFNERTNENKRLSARNYSIFGPNSEQYDSLQSTDSSYLDSLKGETQIEDRQPLFINSVIVNDSRKRDSDISQIEANIDNIIGSPIPLLTTALKSTSLDSVKSSADKNVEDRRKTISIENSLSGHIIDKNTQEVRKSEPETYVSITHLNKEIKSIQAKTVEPKLSKSDEKLKTNSKPGIPEFLNIQLNKVDSKPVTNVVLTANVTPKKPEPVTVVENNARQDTDDEKDMNETPLQMYLRKTGSQNLLNRSLEFLGDEPPKIPEKPSISIKNSPLNPRKSAPLTALPQTPTTPKTFLRKKPILEEFQIDKSRTNSLNSDSNEKLSENISIDQKSYSSYGSKTSLQSSDSNEARTPEKQEDGVVYRRKPMIVPKEQRNGTKNDDEPELMKVFARRSLKLKDSEAEVLAQEIAEANIAKEEFREISVKSKFMKNEFNSSIKSRDSDKENYDNLENSDIKIIDLDSNKEGDDLPNIQSRASHFGGTHYQRSISTNSVASTQTTTKRDSAPAQMRNEVSKYRKEIADSTPEKRLRNRTFPDPTTDREDIKGINVKSEGLAYKTDTAKRPWLQKKEDDDKCYNNNSVNDNKLMESVVTKKEREGTESVPEGATDGSPQFKGILQMRAEWERRAKQGMTK